MIMRLWHYRTSLALAVAACLLLLLAAGARLFATGTSSIGGTTLVIPVWPARTLTINIWLRDSVAAFWPDASGSAIRDGERVIKDPGSVTIALWYQDRATATTARLAIFRVPTWPLLLLAAMLAASAYLLCPRRSLHRRSSPSGTKLSDG